VGAYMRSTRDQIGIIGGSEGDHISFLGALKPWLIGYAIPWLMAERPSQVLSATSLLLGDTLNDPLKSDL